MVYLKALDNIFGKMEAFTKEILSKVLEVDMGFGVYLNNKEHKIIKAIIIVIKNRVMVFMSGRMDGLIKEILKMIIEMVMDSFMIKINWYIKVIGRMDSKHPINKEV